MLDKFTRAKNGPVRVSPAVNMYDRNGDIILALEMPGADKESLDINLNGNQLTVRGKTRQEEIGKDYTPLHQERRGVEYERRFEINASIDRDKIQARYDNGILEVVLTKAEAAQPRKIMIQSS